MYLYRDLIIEDLVNLDYTDEDSADKREQELEKLPNDDLLKMYLETKAYDSGWFGSMDKKHIDGVANDIIFKKSEVKLFVLKDEEYGFSVDFIPSIIEGYDQHATVEDTEELDDMSNGSSEMSISFDNDQFDKVIAHLDSHDFNYVVREMDSENAWEDF